MFLRETIVYDCLSYVFNPVFKQIVAASQKVTYIYSASGGKLATNANGSLTYYRSVMVYGNDNKLLYILTPEGTVTRNEGSSGTTYTYNYFKKDHIGSTRAVLSAVDDTLQTVQSTDYYPFGLAFEYNKPEQEQISVLREGVAGREPRRFDAGPVRLRGTALRFFHRALANRRSLCKSISKCFSV